MHDYGIIRTAQPYVKLANNLSAFMILAHDLISLNAGFKYFCNAQRIYFHELQSSLANFENLPCSLARTFTSDLPVMGRRE